MHTAAPSRPVEVLLVEDDPGHVRVAHAIIRDADADIWVRLNIVTDGRQAAAFLRREGPYVNAPRPDLVLLDGKLPPRDALAVTVETGRGEPAEIPVVALREPREGGNFRLGSQLNRWCRITTASEVEACQNVVNAIKGVWRGMAGLCGGDTDGRHDLPPVHSGAVGRSDGRAGPDA